MKITDAAFVMSNSSHEACPKPDRPEYAFIGRSNVGKSSLINALTNRKSLAKTSGTPGKTQLINHFLINQGWYLVDLPGYGWAQVSKSLRKGFSAMIEGYITRRTNLCCTFVLVDIRHEPQAIDLNFIRWMGENGLPIAIVFTKADKLKSEAEALRHVDAYRKVLLQEWEETPPCFITSADKRHGLDALLAFIHEANGRFVPV